MNSYRARLRREVVAQQKMKQASIFNRQLSNRSQKTNNTRRRTHMNAIMRFLKDEEGATAIEYGLIAALLSVVIILAVTATGEAVRDTFQAVADAM